MSADITSNADVKAEDDYSVPGEPGVYFCARHKSVKTRLRCGRCEKPICPKCMKMGPVGARCAACASNRDSHVYQVKPLQFVLAFFAAFGCSLLAALLSSFGGLIIFLILYAPAAGTLIGKVIVRVVRGKRGVPLALVASAGILAGALVPLDALFTHAMPMTHYLNFYLWIYIVVAIPTVWYWVR